MNASLLFTQSQRLLKIGIVFFFYSAFEGFIISLLGWTRIGLSVHTLSGIEGVFLLAGVAVAATETWRHCIIGRVLVHALRSARDPRRLHHRGDLGCRHSDDRIDGRTAAWPYTRHADARDNDSSFGLFVGAASTH